MISGGRNAAHSAMASGQKLFDLRTVNGLKRYTQYLNKYAVMPESRKYALQIVANNGLDYQYLNKDLKNDINIIKIAVNQNPWTFILLSEEWQNNKEIAEIAFNKNNEIYFEFTPSLQNKLMLEFARTESAKVINIIEEFRLKNESFVEKINKEQITEDKHNSQGR